MDIGDVTKKEIEENYPKPEYDVFENGSDRLLLIKNLK